MVQKSILQVLPVVINPGFEDSLNGWKTSGMTETSGYSGKMRLIHPGGDAFLESTQTLSDISNDWDPFHPTSGNNWENQALFDYNNRALPAMNLFNHP